MPTCDVDIVTDGKVPDKTVLLGVVLSGYALFSQTHPFKILESLLFTVPNSHWLWASSKERFFQLLKLFNLI